MTNAEQLALGAHFQNLGNLGRAEVVYRQLLDGDGNDLNAMYRLAVVWQLQGRNGDAVALYQRLLRARPDAAKVYNNLGLAYAAQNRLADALTCYQHAIRLKLDFAEAFNNLGNLHSEQGDAVSAEVALRHALALQPCYPAAWINLARLCGKAHRFEEAERCFREALAQQPGNATILNGLGNTLLEQGKWHAAGDCFSEAIRLHPTDAEAYFNRARILSSQQRWPEAAASLQTSTELNPDNAEAHCLLAGILHWHLHQLAEALPRYQRVLELAPEDAKARLMVDALRGQTTLTQVPAGYIHAVYDLAADQFDASSSARGECNPALLQAALTPSPTGGLDIIDLGCGTGLCGVCFRPSARSLRGVDLSPTMLAKARARGIYDALTEGDALLALQANPQPCDLVVASDVLCFYGNLMPITRAVANVLRPGGHFAFTLDWHQGPEDFRLTPWVHFAHSLQHVANIAAENQLRQVRVQHAHFPGYPAAPGKQAIGLVVVLQRRLDS
jgi:predicted TPR repeat methyltransferase